MHSRSSSLLEPMLESEEQDSFIRAWQENRDPKALDRVVRAYMRLCYKIAAEWSKNNEEMLEDLAQEGVLGIQRAMEKFDFSFNTKFSTYCYYWIQNFICDAVSRTKNTIHVPSRTFLEVSRGRLDEKKQREAYLAIKNVVSIDAPVEEGFTLADKIPDDRHNPEKLMVGKTQNSEFKRLVAKGMSCLNDREKHIIIKRKLIDPPLTLEELSVEFNVTRERIRQIENMAMQKMARALSSDKVADHFED